MLPFLVPEVALQAVTWYFYFSGPFGASFSLNNTVVAAKNKPARRRHRFVEEGSILRSTPEAAPLTRGRQILA